MLLPRQPQSDISNIDTAYLITTRRSKLSFYTSEDRKIGLFTNDLFWRFIVDKSGLIEAVDTMLHRDKMLCSIKKLLVIIHRVGAEDEIKQYIRILKDCLILPSVYDGRLDDDTIPKETELRLAQVGQEENLEFDRESLSSILRMTRELGLTASQLRAILTASTLKKLDHDDFSETLSRVRESGYKCSRIERKKFASIVLALATIKNYDGEPHYESITDQFFYLRHIKESNIYVTHHWYNRKLLDLDLKGDKLAFLETLIAIVHADSRRDGIVPRVKLYAHSKDIFDHGIRDAIVSKYMLMANCIELSENTELAKVIAQGHCYAFQHDEKKSMFFRHVLAPERMENVQVVLERFLTISKQFAKAQILELPGKYDGAVKKCIHIHLDFSSGLEYQFPSLFNAIVDFNLHAWKANRKFIPQIFDHLFDTAEKKRTHAPDPSSSSAASLVACEQESRGAPCSEKMSIEEFTHLPILLSSDRKLVGQSEQDLTMMNPKARYLDSSIWLRFITVPSNTCNTSNIQFWIRCQVNALFPSDFFVYKTANAREIREFNARLCLHSRLQDFVSGHGKHVTPFPFCSEEENRKESELQWEKLLEKLASRKCKLRILLIDDKSQVKDRSKSQSISKKDVLKDVLKKYFYVTDELSKHDDEATKEAIKKPIIVLHSVHTLEEATDAMNERKYDILLLDYLLEYDKHSRKLSKASYGTDLLEEIVSKYNTRNTMRAESRKNWFQHRGPLKKFWIFFVSTFSSAIREHMRVKNMHYSEPYWHIARGACPSITPELFRNNFLYLLNQQIRELTDIGTGMDNLDTERWVVTLIDFLQEIFANDAKKVRQAAVYGFNSFLRLRSHYNTLYADFDYKNSQNTVQKDDTSSAPEEPLIPLSIFTGKKGAEQDAILSKKLTPHQGDASPKQKEPNQVAHSEDQDSSGSLLVRSLFPDIVCYGNSFWRHMQHLFYLIAFGNVSQWEIMWDEYICVKNALAEGEKCVKYKANICGRLEEYIIKLRTLNNN